MAPHEIELPSPNICWALLERIAESSQLRRSPRLREFLFYVGRRSLKEGCEQVPELEIGVQVFGRPESYDTNVDNIVRVNATELRKRVAAYFESEGIHEPVILEIPRGSYKPVFRIRPQKSPQVASNPVVEAVPIIPTASSATSSTRTEVGLRLTRVAMISATLAISLLASVCLILAIQVRTLRRSLYPWRYAPVLAQLWSPFFDDNKETDLITTDTAFSMIQVLRKQSYSFNDYLSRSYLIEPAPPNSSPDFQAALQLIGSKYLSSADTFRLAQYIMALDPTGKRIHLYHARDYTPALIKQHNVILIGGRITNPWEEIFDKQLNFTVSHDQNRLPMIINRAPNSGEPSVYPRDNSTGYSVAAYLPNPDDSGKVLVIEGTTSESTEAAGDFLLSEEQLSNFEKTLHVTHLPYFNVLLKTSLVKGTPLSATVLSYRTYPNPQ